MANGELDLGEVVTQAVQTHRALFDHRRIAMAVPPVPFAVRVLADRDKIIQVLTNLLPNAAKFTPPGGQVHRPLLDGAPMPAQDGAGSTGIPTLAETRAFLAGRGVRLPPVP